MKFHTIRYCFAITAFMSAHLFAANSNPVVTNVSFTISGTTVTVNYDVADAEQSTLTISMEVSENKGTTWTYNFNNPTTATGSLGDGIGTGTGKKIYWTYNGANSSSFQIRIIANDLQIDAGPCADPAILYDGITYNTVQIGKQCWLKENLNVGTFNTTKYCYGDVEANCATYGGLYTWAQAMSTTAGSPGICPTGWHVPTNDEFTTLRNSAGNNTNSIKKSGQGINVGAGTNTTGFSALLAGFWDGTYNQLSATNHFWSSTESAYPDQVCAYNLLYFGNNSNWNEGQHTKTYRYSVRCLKD